MIETMKLADVGVICHAGGRTIDLGNQLAVTDDKMVWHDHSRQGGDIVCTGPFSLFVPECKCCPLTCSGSGHCGHSDCYWETGRP